jgi:hypothetical protein
MVDAVASVLCAVNAFAVLISRAGVRRGAESIIGNRPHPLTAGANAHAGRQPDLRGDALS